MDMQRACHNSPTLSWLGTADLVSTALPASIFFRQQVLHSWMQVLVAAARAKQLRAHIQIAATAMYSVLMSFCKSHFAVSAQLPPEGPCLALGVAWGDTFLWASIFFLILGLLIISLVFIFLCVLGLDKMHLQGWGAGMELKLKNWDRFYTNNWVVQRLWE